MAKKETDANEYLMKRDMGILQDMREINEKIYGENGFRAALLVLNEVKAQFETLTAAIEAEALDVAKRETGEDGRPINTNDTLRFAAKKQILSKDTDYLAVRDDQAKTDREIAVIKRQIDFLNQEFKILGTEAQLLMAKLSALSNAQVVASNTQIVGMLGDE